ncbi:hypothetical protein SeMB42_g02401 [Synchytrium endobioticum]|uniref:Dynactin subunit 6 n=1 Tax=Synchytrium endobioticum TaxID=286115 RepID=A0A507DEK3_9FUNG|nr:hypothetical protein SeMB42_g02401 [Synchytrium endobioticum]
MQCVEILGYLAQGDIKTSDKVRGVLVEILKQHRSGDNGGQWLESQRAPAAVFYYVVFRTGVIQISCRSDFSDESSSLLLDLVNRPIGRLSGRSRQAAIKQLQCIISRWLVVDLFKVRTINTAVSKISAMSHTALNAQARNTICEDASQSGPITLGANNIIHPKSTITVLNDECGEIVIGSNNIIEECAIIVNRNKEPLVIGDNNLFGVRSVFEGVGIGSDCILEAKSHVLSGTSIGSNCIIGANCSTNTDDTIPDHTILYGNGFRRTQVTSNASLHHRHIDYLKEVLPKYHHVKTTV